MVFCIINFLIAEKKYALGIMTILGISELLEKILYYKETKDQSVIKEIIGLVLLTLGLLIVTIAEYIGK